MADSLLQIRETESGLEIRLHVQPRAKRSEIAGVHDGALKIKVTAPPVDDAANRAVTEFLAAYLGFSKSRIRILSGFHSRQKIVQLKGMTGREFRKRFSNL